MVECAVAVLKDHKGAAMHHAEVAREAIQRGYVSPRGITDISTVSSSFWDGMRRVKDDPKVPIVFLGKRRFRYVDNKESILSDQKRLGITDDEGEPEPLNGAAKEELV